MPLVGNQRDASNKPKSDFQATITIF